MAAWRAWGERALWAVRHRALLAEAFGTALTVERLLRWAPFTATLAWTRASRRPDRSLPSLLAARRAIRFAYAALPFPRTCLRESLVLRRMWARRGVATELRLGVQLGVQRADARLASHAWLEDTRGVTLTDALDHFIPFPLDSDAPLRT